jgi:hypothetical protein
MWMSSCKLALEGRDMLRCISCSYQQCNDGQQSMVLRGSLGVFGSIMGSWFYVPSSTSACIRLLQDHCLCLLAVDASNQVRTDWWIADW